MGFNKTWWVTLLPDFLRGKRCYVLKRRGELCDPVYLLPGTSVHLVAAKRLQVEVLGKDQLPKWWPTNWVCMKGKCTRIITWEFSSSGSAGGDFVSGAESYLPALHSLVPQLQRMIHKQPGWFRIIQDVYWIWGSPGPCPDIRSQNPGWWVLWTHCLKQFWLIWGSPKFEAPVPKILAFSIPAT